MTPFTSILVATDFSIDGNNAVRRAALLAHAHGARLKLVHVLDPAGCKPLRDWFSPSIDIDLSRCRAAKARQVKTGSDDHQRTGMCPGVGGDHARRGAGLVMSRDLDGQLVCQRSGGVRQTLPQVLVRRRLPGSVKHALPFAPRVFFEGMQQTQRCAVRHRELRCTFDGRN